MSEMFFFFLITCHIQTKQQSASLFAQYKNGFSFTNEDKGKHCKPTEAGIKFQSKLQPSI